MLNQDNSRLLQPRQPMPAEVRTALEARRLMDAYNGRPPYQRNDYLGWIARAKRPETRQKRLEQMLEELKHSNVYMKMNWTGKAQ